jgi:hypothetical protein
MADGLHIYEKELFEREAQSELIYKPDLNDRVFLLKLIPSTNPLKKALVQTLIMERC